VPCNNAAVSNRQLTGGILTLWLISPLGVTKEQLTITRRFELIKELKPCLRVLMKKYAGIGDEKSGALRPGIRLKFS